MNNLVLVIDDDELILNTVKYMLSKLNYDVIIATNGNEAIELFKVNKDKIKFVISDVVMYPLDGLEIMYQIKNIKDDVPYILTSGYNINIDTLTYNDKPINFLKKPYLYSMLVDTIEKIK